MKLFKQPVLWLLVFSLPTCLLLVAELSVFSILDSELNKPEHFLRWYSWMGSNAVMLIGATLLFGWFWLRKKSVEWYLPVLILGYEIFQVYVFLNWERTLIPWSVPDWMIDDDEFFMMHFSLCMPAMFWSLLHLCSLFIRDEEQPIWKSVLWVLLIPGLWFAFFWLAIPLLNYSENYALIRVLEKLGVILFVASSLLFFFFLIKTLLLFTIQRSFNPTLKKVFQVLVMLVFPTVGLIVNDYSNPMHDKHLFGDFSHWSFYACVLLSGALILIPSTGKLMLDRGLLAARIALLPFSAYFLVVFLPFLPLSILAIIFIGLGFLILAPVLFFVFHVQRVVQDFSSEGLVPDWKWKGVVLSTLVILPLLLTLNYQMDRQELNRALNYVYQPDYSQTSMEIDTVRLKDVLGVIRVNGSERNLFQGKSYWKPYLSTYYRWLVLDNLTLSNTKVQELEMIFLGHSELQAPSWRRLRMPQNDSTRLASAKFETKKHPNYYSTWIHLDIENAGSTPQEFISDFELPEGVFIHNYYLDIGNKREYGILAEKKSAQWVYQNIVAQRTDPGLLNYTSGNKVQLRVFPLNAHEVRKTGFEVIHKGGVDLPFVKHSEPALPSATSDGITYRSESDLHNTPVISRQPRYYFLLDNSIGCSEKKKVAIFNEVKKQLKGLKTSRVEFIAVNSGTMALNPAEWEKLYLVSSPQGGFFPQRAMKSLLKLHYETPSNDFPVFVLVGESKGVEIGTLGDWTFASPDFDHYFWAQPDSNLRSYEFRAKEQEYSLVNSLAVIPSQVRRLASGRHVRAGAPSVEMGTFSFEEIPERTSLWTSAAIQQLNSRYLTLHGDEEELRWRKLVQQNIQSGILSRYTSYLVVETEAQKEVLLKKQKEVLAAKPAFDLEQEAVSMSEPSWIWYAVLAVVAAIVWRRKSKVAINGNG